MNKKTILLEIPCELIDRIDTLNNKGDRSEFVSELITKQIQESPVTTMKNETDISEKLEQFKEKMDLTGQINITLSDGNPVGKFDINTVEGFQELAKTIQNISKDPVVRIRASRWL